VPTLYQRSSILEVLATEGLLSARQCETLALQGAVRESDLHAALIKDGVLSEEQLAEALAKQYGLAFEGLEDVRIDFGAYPDISPDWMTRYCFAPLRRHGEVLTIAIPNPHELTVIDAVESLLKCELNLVVAPRAAILEAVRESQRNGQVVARVKEEFRPLLVQENEQGEEVLSPEKITKDQSPVVALVDTIILNALPKRASDIHIEPADGRSEVKYRIDGVLYLGMEPLDGRFHNALVSRIKVMSELDIAERRIPQDGRFKLRINKRTIDFRVSIIPSAFGESVVIRILAKEEFTASQKGLHLDSLGLRREDLERFRRAITASYGMVLITGPTGSGKTTTLYGALNEVNTKEDKVITIEDPVEYQLKGVIQIPVNEKKGLTFARGLRSILRHDPDKIMVGEIRDAETAQIAIQSALTGHLVFSTVHANNSFDVIGRFVNMGIEPYNFVSALNCIMAQRLVRSLCVSCKVPVSVSPDECQRLGYDPATFDDRVLYDSKGCVDCHQLGFRGRVALTEFLAITETIKDLILERRPPSEIRKAAVQGGMVPMRQAGIEKILAGTTTMKEVNRMTFLG
jgi:type IV pilus assembly protein PilB